MSEADDLDLRRNDMNAEKILDHKWLDPACIKSGCQSLVWKGLYESAVQGRRDFRQAFKDARDGKYPNFSAAFEAGVAAAASVAVLERPAPPMDEIIAALVEQYDAMLEEGEAFTNKPDEEKTDGEIKREYAAMDRYTKAERNVMRLSYPLWRAQNLERSITVNAHCDGRIHGFLPPLPRDEREDEIS